MLSRSDVIARIITLVMLGFILCFALINLGNAERLPDDGVDVAPTHETDIEPLYCYEPYGTKVMPEYQVSHTLIRINWLDQTRGNTVEAEWIYDEATNMSLCEVWIRIPEQILGDPDMDSVGHEFTHCLTGNFHPEDK